MRVENAFGDNYDEFKIGVSFRLQGGQVVMQFLIRWIECGWLPASSEL